MAQGFVRNLNLVESSTKTSDEQILDNLGGIGISKDIKLFNGNTKIKSTLINDPNALSKVLLDFELIEEGKTYKIIDTGEDRDWSVFGTASASPSVGLIFVATAQNGSIVGSGGIVREVVGQTDFDIVEDLVDGWTVIVRLGIGKTAYTTGTKLSLDRGITYPIKVVNSDGFTRFQIALVNDSNNTPLVVTGGQFTVGGNDYSINDVSFTRDDAVTTENVSNIYVEHPVVTNLVEAASIPIEDKITSPFERDQSVSLHLVTVTSKKTKVILSYLDDYIDENSGVNFDGAIRIRNLDNSSGLNVLIGNKTQYNNFVVGYTYEITDLGNNASLWNLVGGDSLVYDDQPSKWVDSGSFVQGKVYKIKTLGTAAVGTNGTFTFGDAQVNENANTISLPLGHNLVVGDKLVYRQGTGSIITNLSPPDGGASDGVYYVQSAGANTITLATNPGGSPLSLSVPGAGGNDYTLTLDPQARWNAIAGTTGVFYGVEGSAGSPTSYFKATGTGAEISGAKVNLAQFKATSRGVGGDATALAKAINPPGLYILNPQTGSATRAFSDPSNPWTEQAAYVISKNTGGNLTINSLKTESLIAQAQDFNFDRADTDNYNALDQGDHYVITELGSGRDWNAVSGGAKAFDKLEVGKQYTIVNAGNSRNWNYLAGTDGLSYTSGTTITILRDPSAVLGTGSGGTANQIFSEGDGFFASGSASGSGTGGKAKGTAKLVFLDSDQDAYDGNGLDSKPETRIASFTHKVPIVINGEEYSLLAHSTPADVTAGFYKVLTY